MPFAVRLSSVVATVGTLLGLLAALAAEPAHAQSGPDPETLFRDAKRDLEEGRVAVACSKFAASYEQSGVAGALLSWADCEERLGHLRLAHELFSKGVIAVAGDVERRDFARERGRSLLGRLAKLELDVAPGAVSVTIDGETVSPASLPLLDPGEHRVVATWPSGDRDEETITLTAGEARRMRLAPPAPPPSPVTKQSEAKPVATSQGATLRTAGWIVGGAGALAGLVFGGTAVAVAVECPDQRCPSGMEGVLIGNAVSGAVAAAGLGAGAFLLGFGYAEEGSLSVAIDAGPDRGILVGRLRF